MTPIPHCATLRPKSPTMNLTRISTTSSSRFLTKLIARTSWCAPAMNLQNMTEVVTPSTTIVILYLMLIVLLKIFASAATNGAGGTGGLFAPSLFVGCITGYILVLIFDVIGVQLPAQNFALAGMAGLMSGIMHAPLTGIFLTAELSGGYTLFMPLMIVSVISFITIYVFEPHSLYAMRLAQKGELVTHHKDRAVLTQPSFR